MSGALKNGPDFRPLFRPCFKQAHGAESFPVRPKFHQRAQAPGRPLGGFEDRNIAGLQDVERLDGRGGITGVDKDGFFLFLYQGHQISGGLLFQFGHVGRDNVLESAEKAGDVNPVHLFVFHTNLDALGDHVRVFFRRAAVVDRVRCRHPFQEKRLYPLLCLPGKYGNFHSVDFCIVCRNGVVPAPFGKNGHTLASWNRARAQGVGHVEQFIHITHPHNARLSEGGIHYERIPCERSRVGSGRPGPSFGLSHFEGDDRLVLCRFTRHLDQTVPVLDSLQVDHDRFGLRIVFEILDVFRETDPDRVAQADDLAESHSSDAGIVGERIDDIAALGKDRNRSLLQWGNTEQIHLRRSAEHTAAIGADHISAGLCCFLKNLGLDLFALRSALSETGRDNNHAFGAHLHAVGNRRHKKLRGHYDHDQVHLFFDRRDVRIGFSAEQFGSLRVDQVNITRIPSLDQTPGSSFSGFSSNL